MKNSYITKYMTPPDLPPLHQKTPLEDLALIEKHLAEMSSELQKIKCEQAVLRQLILDTLSLLKASKQEAPAREGLTDKQREVFEKIDAVEGTDAAALARVQELLDTLEGDSLTENFVDHLKYLLKVRSCGFVCPSCGAPSTLVKRKERIQFSHDVRKAPSQPLQHVTHSGRTIFRDFTLVHRPDKRRAENRE